MAMRRWAGDGRDNLRVRRTAAVWPAMSGGSGSETVVGERELNRARDVGVGCFTAFVGAPSGAMVGVFVAKMVGAARKCVPVEGLPACNWWTFALIGGVVGMVSLPTLVLWRLRRGKAATRPTF
jgi:hypothetical protein